MTATHPMFFKGCTQHPEEPIIRVSLDLKHPKLLYCQECLEGLDNNFKGNLVKFSHLGDKLFEDYTRKYEDYLESVPCAGPGEYKVKIETFITQQKAKAEKEFDKIQSEILEILSNSKTEVFKTLDKIRTNLLIDCEASIEQTNNLADPSTFEGKDITRDEIYKELTENEDSVAEVEKRIRKRLELMKQLDDIKEETRIGLSRYEKAKLNSLNGLDTYLEALIFTKEKKEAGEDRQLNVPSAQSQLIRVLNEAVEACQEPLVKTKDRVASFIEGMIGLYYSDPTKEEGQALLDGMGPQKKVVNGKKNSTGVVEEADGIFDFEECF